MKVDKKYLFFTIALYMFVFQFAIMRYVPICGYLDELYALMCVPLVIVNCRGKVKIKNNYVRKIVIALALFVFIGIFSNFIYRYQVWGGVLQDILLNLKFFMSIATTYYLFRDFKIDEYQNKIKVHVKILIFICFVLVLQNKITHIFPVANRRFGLDAEVLFFNHPTELASVTFFLMLVLMLCHSNLKKDCPYIFMGVVVVALTLRFKALAAVMIFVYMYFIVMIAGKKMKFRYFAPLIPLCLLVGGEEFYFYFFSESSMEMARGALSLTSLKIAINTFPLGTGFGTFASWPSGVFYSPVYEIYGISEVWGLTREWAGLVSDVFWPMVIAQNGFVGLILYTYIIVYLFKLVLQCSGGEAKLYMAGIAALLYLMVSSIAESAFVNPLAVPLAFIIGLVLCANSRKEGSVLS